MGDVTKATASEPTDEPGRRSALLDEQWRIGPKMHGGYLLAVLARAAVDELGGPGSDGTAHTVPHAVTGTFLRAPDPGPAVVTVDVLRRGRGVSQVRTRLDQDGAPCVEAGVVLAAPPDTADPDLTAAPIALTPFEACERRPVATEDGRGGLPLMEVVDTRIDPDCLGFVAGRPRGEGRISGWGELATREPWSSSALLVALDLLPPGSFDLGLTGWTPTMSLTAHVHAEPAPGPVRLTQWVDHLAGDRLHEHCRAWDTTGRLVGSSSQLAAVRR